MSPRVHAGCGFAGVALCLAVVSAEAALPAAPLQPGAPLPAATAAPLPPSPRALFTDLFDAVQGAQVFADSKTFADAVPTSAPAQIMARFHSATPVGREALQRFVADNFSLPSQANGADLPAERVDIARHIDVLWDRLTRSSSAAPRYSSLLPVPEPYVVPGGRFRELYYWDSYFTMLGLARSGRPILVEHMVRDFARLIDTYGHVPNGTRSYYLSRSQPPFFYAMVGLVNAADPAAADALYLPQLRREYGFWMQGEAGLRRGAAHRRVVAMPDGAVLNRYWDDADTPREESFREDTELARRSGRIPRQLYRDLRAAAESGWDFSTRWFADGQRLEAIDTTEIVPVDLNSLLFGLEQAIGAGCARAGDTACAAEFTRRAAARRAACPMDLVNTCREPRYRITMSNICLKILQSWRRNYHANTYMYAPEQTSPIRFSENGRLG
jgi:alpha,alpha-trehalase